MNNRLGDDMVQFSLFIAVLTCGMLMACGGRVVAPPSQNVGLSRGAVKDVRGESVKEWAAGLRKAKTFKDKVPYLKAMDGYKPKTGQEVRELAVIATEAKDVRGQVATSVYRAFDTVKPEDQQLEPVFREMVKHKDLGVRYMAMKNCGVLKSKKAMPLLIKQLAGMGNIHIKSLEEGGWQLMGLEAGLSLYGKEALPELLKLYKQSENKVVKDYVRETVREMKDKAAAGELLEIVKDRSNPEDLRKTVIETLGAMRVPEIVPQLVEVYGSETNMFVKSTLIFNIAYLKSEESVTFLTMLILDGKTADNRASAASAISKIRDSRVSAILLQALQTEKSTEVRRAIVSSLHELTGKEYDWKTGREK